MVEETEISGPETETDETTLTDEVFDETTSDVEVNSGENSAETETGVNSDEILRSAQNCICYIIR